MYGVIRIFNKKHTRSGCLSFILSVNKFQKDKIPNLHLLLTKIGLIHIAYN